MRRGKTYLPDEQNVLVSNCHSSPKKLTHITIVDHLEFLPYDGRINLQVLSKCIV